MATATAPAQPVGTARDRWERIRHAVKVNTSLRIDPDIFADAKEYSSDTGFSLNQYFEEAIRVYNLAQAAKRPAAPAAAP